MKRFKIKKTVPVIDMVYTWVDGNDEKIIKEKQELLKEKNFTIESTHKARFFNNDELKYSLRSLEKFANWINKIYIVTNNQCPSWLNTQNPRVKIINHEEIMPQGSQPCYNSNAIEHCIKNIPNLSEHYLYGNDDCFFFDKVTPEFFFKKGKPICRFEKNLFTKSTNDCLYRKFLLNSYKLIYDKYKKSYPRFPSHNIDAYKKSIVQECYETFKPEIDRTIFSHLRKETDIQKSIYNSYALATKKAIEKRVSKIDSFLPLHLKILHYFLKIYKKDFVVYEANYKFALWGLINYRPTLFCINDGEITTDTDRKRVKGLLEALFPEKSEFEL